jgi:AraC family transcriptional regulator
MQKKCSALKRHVLKNISRRITTVELADIAVCSECHFSRKFKLTSGTTPGQFVASARVRCAKSKIRFGVPLAIVAIACGFASQAHLSTAFKRHTGSTPGQYQREALRDRG